RGADRQAARSAQARSTGHRARRRDGQSRRRSRCKVTQSAAGGRSCSGLGGPRPRRAGGGGVRAGLCRCCSRRAAGTARQSEPIVYANRTQVTAIAGRAGLPAVYGFREFAMAGGLISYAASLPDIWRRIAGLVDKILKGANPGDLPIERPTQFELVVNLKTAKSMGLTIPEPFLLL